MKTFLNRLISKVFKWLYFINQKSLFKGFIFISLTLFVFGIICLLIPRLTSVQVSQHLNTEKYQITDLDSYIHIYKTVSDRLGNDFNPDFSNDNFVKRKLKKFIAIAYVTAKNDSTLFTKNFDFISYKHLVNELNVIFEIEHFYQSLFGCQELQKFSFHVPILETRFSLTYDVSFKEEVFATQSVRANIEELISAKCVKHQNEETKFRCFLLKNRRLLQQYLFLSELKHPNVVQLKGVCFKTSEASDDSFPGLTLMKEGGRSFEIQDMKSMPWNIRLKMIFDLIQLLDFFSSNTLGSIQFSDLSPVNFVITENNQLKVSNFDQVLSVIEKPCETDNDCFVSTKFQTECVLKTCLGYNERRNMQQIYLYFIEPLLNHNTPSALRKDIVTLLQNIETLQYSSLNEILTKLKTLTVEQQKENLKNNKEMNAVDGLQVDSWEQHENIVSINEIGLRNFEVGNTDNKAGKKKEITIFNEHKGNIADNYGYEKIDNADFPGRFDYYCPHSKAEWGCVISLKSLRDAALKCDIDSKCKAFITMPHLRKEGWIIAIMKSDNASPVDHAGTTVYVKIKDSGIELADIAGFDVNDNPTYANCWKTIVDEQIEIRNKKEIDFMNSCGWNGFKTTTLHDFILENTIKEATSFKPAIGKLSVGGQIHIKVEMDSQVLNCIFSAKGGPVEYHLAHLAAYHLDRMLGLYKTVPVYLRTLTEIEMKDAGFPRDIGGAQFDTFISLKSTTDHSLTGTITPLISSKVGWEHYITVPKLDFITNAVTPFSKRQLDDMEYLLLIWLSSLPMPQKGFLCVEDHLLILTKMEEGFRLNPTEEVIGYFYNCQFPKSFIAVMKRFHEENCYLGDQLLSHIKHYYPNLRNDAFKFGQAILSDIVTRNANRLLEIVDACVDKFGEEKVFYSF